MLSKLKNTKLKKYSLICIPLLIFILDQIFLSRFLSKYEYRYIGVIITIVWIVFLVRYLILQVKLENQDPYYINKRKPLAFQCIAILFFSVICYGEFNRVPSFILTTVYGAHHSMTLDVKKSHPTGKSYCSGLGKLDLVYPIQDAFFSFCLTDKQDNELPSGQFKVKFDVIESKFGIIFYNVHPTVAS
ncbi:hypothetical protein [uncultured Tolumonas sp.]|uniref:hypothetical protein n=1 Tax=uncultured Tolumonas sp. TaxID=263765 RepID=UPI00292E5C0F|nr:hypothetical protein [uncultured Tolumonas sp.]